MTILAAKHHRPSEGGASFSFKNRLVRLLWSITWNLCASWTPAPFHRFRVALIRLFGGDVDWSAHVYGTVKIWLPSQLTMEAHSCLGPNVNCYCMGRITLRSGSIVSQNVTLCAGSHDVSDPHFQLITKPIEIGKNAWVAAEAFIGPGAVVGEAAVIGARTTLFGVAEPGWIYAGNPAKKIKERIFKKTNG